MYHDIITTEPGQFLITVANMPLLKGVARFRELYGNILRRQRLDAVDGEEQLYYSLDGTVTPLTDFTGASVSDTSQPLATMCSSILSVPPQVW